MKIGITLHPDAGADAVINEARIADGQGWDSVWLSDHLMMWRGQDPTPDRPFDTFTLMSAIAAVTQNVRMGWATLNLSFRLPGVLAKMVTTLDQISHGRLICCVGSGWFEEECRAYNIPMLEDHDERAEYAREVIELWLQLWTHPAPERVTYEGKYVQVYDLPFNPEPFQKPHPTIWYGGDSDVSLALAKRFATGWMVINSGNPQRLAEARSAADWPAGMTVAKGGRLIVHQERELALADARREYAILVANPATAAPPTFEDFLAREVIGTPEDCLDRLTEFESWGANYYRANFANAEAQERAARLLLPRLGEVEQRLSLASST